MNEATAIETMSARFSTNWPVLQPSVPFGLINEAFDSRSLSVFARMKLSGPIATRQLTQGPVGSRKFERKGILAVELYGSTDTGANPLSVLVASVLATLESQQLSTLADPVYLGASSTTDKKNGSWYIKTVLIPFTFYETR